MEHQIPGNQSNENQAKVEQSVLITTYDSLACDMKPIVELQTKVFGTSPTEEEFIQRLALESKVCINIATVNGKPCGFAVGYEKKKKYYLWLLGVLPDCRGQGLATKLIGAQQEHAKKVQLPVIFVKSSPRWKEMLRLLIKLDFILCGFKANEWGSDSAVWFEKKLS